MNLEKKQGIVKHDPRIKELFEEYRKQGEVFPIESLIHSRIDQAIQEERERTVKEIEKLPTTSNMLSGDDSVDRADVLQAIEGKEV